MSNLYTYISKETYNEKLKEILNKDKKDNEIIFEDYYELTLEDFKPINEFNSTFEVNGDEWKLNISRDNDKEISLSLTNINFKKNFNSYNFLFAFRNTRNFIVSECSLDNYNIKNDAITYNILSEYDYKNILKTIFQRDRITLGFYINYYNDMNLLEDIKSICKKLLNHNNNENISTSMNSQYSERLSSLNINANKNSSSISSFITELMNKMTLLFHYTILIKLNQMN
ncbi:hypothetical protein BCR32DRAFT_265431 [Anaeromyces robustus]|uniref:Uncharacterized protein n=1 Tax=Anaeromyces robustus TaxID=1754192 RepID=A0A1Y1XKC3_9FUNG|nr:hypothetical protein BCR32DRAFT_265431 [Anaeromyces robustus]|eukprot:ORX85794.1 hypothetical protein BCR32DRAFT_265431 [Anaeromyces robustus]